jgi:hypothetical protein
MKKEDVARELMRRIEQLETPGARRGRSKR